MRDLWQYVRIGYYLAKNKLRGTSSRRARNRFSSSGGTTTRTAARTAPATTAAPTAAVPRFPKGIMIAVVIMAAVMAFAIIMIYLLATMAAPDTTTVHAQPRKAVVIGGTRMLHNLGIFLMVVFIGFLFYKARNTAIGKWFRTNVGAFLSGKGGKIGLVLFGLAIMNFCFFLALALWGKAFGTPNWYLILVWNYVEFVILVNTVFFFWAFFYLTGTKQGKDVDKGLKLALKVGAAGLVLAIISTVLGHPIFSPNNIASARSTDMVQGDPEAAARYVAVKYGDLTPDVKWCRDNYFPNEPVAWAIAMEESAGQQFKDRERKIPTHNPKFGSSATGLFEIVDNTSYEIGRHVAPNMSKEEWLMEGEAANGFDRKTLEGNCKSARWLYDHRGVGDWLASQDKWGDVARLQFGEHNFQLAKSTGSIFGGARATIAPNGVRTIELTAPPAPETTQFLKIKDLFPEPFITCGTFTQLDDGPTVMVVVEPGEGAGDRYTKPIPLGNLSFVNRLALQSPTGKPIRVQYTYFAYRPQPGEDLNAACADAYARGNR